MKKLAVLLFGLGLGLFAQAQGPQTPQPQPLQALPQPQMLQQLPQPGQIQPTPQPPMLQPFRQQPIPTIPFPPFQFPSFPTLPGVQQPAILDINSVALPELLPLDISRGMTQFAVSQYCVLYAQQLLGLMAAKGVNNMSKNMQIRLTLLPRQQQGDWQFMVITTDDDNGKQVEIDRLRITTDEDYLFQAAASARRTLPYLPIKTSMEMVKH